MGYGLAGALVTVVVAFPMAFLAVRHASWFSKLLELSNYVTSSMPGIVVGLAFVTVSHPHGSRDLPERLRAAGAAYVLLFLPRALVNLRVRARPGAARTRGGGPLAGPVARRWRSSGSPCG